MEVQIALLYIRIS